MKNIAILVLLCGVLATVSCFKEPDQTFNEQTFVEFQNTVVSTPAVGRTYPIIAVARGAGIRSQQVNLVGVQRPTDSPIKFVVDSLTTAVAGTHFKLGGDGTFSIPANNSFGQCQVEILNPARDSGKSVDLILRLEGNGSDIKPSENYRRIGYRISLN